FIPWLPQWLGPGAFHEFVAGASFPTATVLGESLGPENMATKRVSSYLQLARGIAAFHRGQLPQANEHLKQANEVTREAAEWRHPFSSYFPDEKEFEAPTRHSKTEPHLWPDVIGDLFHQLRPEDIPLVSVAMEQAGAPNVNWWSFGSFTPSSSKKWEGTKREF